MAFTLERNLIHLTTVRVDNRPGRYVLASAAPRSVLSSVFPSARHHTLQISQKETLRLSPVIADIGAVADGMIGVEAWRNRAISIDYRLGLVTYQEAGIHTGLMTIFRYDAEPMIYVNVDGADVAAIVDTTNPDTITLPRATPGRGTARIRVAGTDFDTIDVGYADIATARIGNRLLSRFLVTIDYGKRMVGLWQDPRTKV